MIEGFRFPDKPVETSPEVVAGLDPEQWMVQAKYDGWRLQVYYDGPNQARFLTSVGNPMGKTKAGFQPEMGSLLEKINVPVGTVLDCEFVGPRGHLDPAVYIFDMLAWNGEWLTNVPYEERWARCTFLELPAGPIHLAETHLDEFVAFFERLKATWDGKSIDLWEGIVVKARSGKMKLNRNRHQKSDVMVKIKYRDVKEARY